VDGSLENLYEMFISEGVGKKLLIHCKAEPGQVLWHSPGTIFNDTWEFTNK
jgi:hypothetical protein